MNEKSSTTDTTEVVSVRPVQMANAVDNASILNLTMQTDAVVITTTADYENADFLLKDIKRRSKALEEKRTELTEDIAKGLEKIRSFFRKPLTVLKECEDKVKAKMIDFQAKLEAEREKQQAALEKKQAAEAKKLEEKARKEEEKGNLEKAQELKEKAAIMAAVVPTVDNAVKISGTTITTTWTYKITDPALIPREFLKPDEKKLQDKATTLKQDAKVPGVLFYPVKGISART